MSHCPGTRSANYTITPFGEEHIPAFAAWFNALPHNDVWTEASIRQKTIEGPAYDADLMLAVAEMGEPVGFLLGSIAEGRGWIRAFVVHPDRQRQGIGTLMFDTIEQTLARQGIGEVHAGWAPPSYFLPGVDISYTSAVVFLDQRGYQTNREARVNMDVTVTGRDWRTDQAEAELALRGIRVRRARPEDKPAIGHLCQAHGHEGWAVETGVALQNAPISVFVAESVSAADAQDRVRAFAAYGVTGPAHFGPMLTAAELRGHGIGTVLLKRCLQDWQQASVSRCEIVWAGPISFYARTVGATLGRAFWTFRKSLV